MSEHLANAFTTAGGTRFKSGRETRWGYLIILLFFGGIVGWAAVAPLSTAAVAPGIVTVDGNRKTVQHLEGGIVEEILVRDGSRVIAGQPLIALQRVLTETEFNLLQSQRALAAARESRLAAEYEGSDAIVLPPWLQALANQPDIREAIAGQRDIFASRRALLDAQNASFTQELTEVQNELASYRSKAAALHRQRRLVKQEITEYEALAKQGLVTRTQLFSLKRQDAEIEADVSNNEAVIAAAEQRVGQIRTKLQAVANERTNEVAEQLRDTRDKLVEIEHLIGKARDKLERTVIRAPVDGIVVNLQVHTPGGVIQQGQAILDLVPADEKRVVEARVDPKDRDMIQAGQRAEVRFTAFNQRAFRPIPGRVFNISADAIQGPPPDGPFYRARIELLEDPAKTLDGTQIQPGMQADVLIVTGERTALGYFVAPLLRSFSRAMREQ